MPQKINIAIDGYSSCGKGTLAKQLAKALNYLFIDTGAMYRAVTLAMLNHQIDMDDMSGIQTLLPQLDIHFIYRPEDNFYHTTLNGEDVEDEIRSMEVSNLVSPVSKIDIVRAYLVNQQRKIGGNKGVVMDGRDIGTVVFPDAELKIFMTAKPEIRAQRRYDELRKKGDELVTFDEVLMNINSRDAQDSSRANSPLKPAPDAKVIDNSFMTRDEQFHLALEWALDKIN
ncbi:MAG: (d)CMP kinase [Bacteroidetes bacterium]|nr:(d)CMP kinase [Bacteroidota bacterium]